MAVVWLENRGDKQLRVRPLKTGMCSHPAMCIADFDENGCPDVAVTNFNMQPGAGHAAGEVWLNLTP